jgi:hypothetical protein
MGLKSFADCNVDLSSLLCLFFFAVCDNLRYSARCACLFSYFPVLSGCVSFTILYIPTRNAGFSFTSYHLKEPQFRSQTFGQMSLKIEQAITAPTLRSHNFLALSPVCMPAIYHSLYKHTVSLSFSMHHNFDSCTQAYYYYAAKAKVPQLIFTNNLLHHDIPPKRQKETPSPRSLEPTTSSAHQKQRNQT